MRARAVLVLLAAALAPAAGCGAPPAATRPRSERIVPTRGVIDAFRDAVYAHYEAQLLIEPGHRPGEKTPEEELALAQKSEERSRARLVDALAEAGSEQARSGSGKLVDLVPLLRDALVATGRYTFIVESDPASVSFMLVHLLRRAEERTISVLGEKWTYQLVLYDETLIEDYATYRAEHLAATEGPPVARPVITLGHTIYFDVAAAAQVGREKFFPRVGSYRDLARAAAASDDPFVAQAGDLARLLDVVKDLLRWRSLESFWATIQTQPADVQVERFAEDFEAREEVRAACEAYFLEKAHDASAEPPSGERLTALEKRTYLAAIVENDALGQTATVVGLAALASDLASKGRLPADGILAARLKAAAAVTVALVRQLAPESKTRPDSPAEDARDCARLARASREELEKAARAVLDQLAASKPG
jgi:hypothetical protein